MTTDHPPVRREVLLHRRVARLTPNRIDIRPSRAAVLGPLLGFGLGVASALTIWFGMATLPLWLLALLLIVAVIAIPFAGLGTIYALLGAHVVIDRAKGSATWQQGFLGMGVGTTELVPFAKIERWIVEEAGHAPHEPGRAVEEFAQWRILLLKKSGRRLEVALVTVPRAYADLGFARAREVAEAIGALTDAEVELPIAPAPEPIRPPAAERRRRRRAQHARRR